MKNWIVTAGLLAVPALLLAETELKGNPEELRQFLHPVEHTVTLTGTHEEKAFSDKAIVNLVITTKADRLDEAMRINTQLRTTIARTLLDAGVNEQEINTSKFSSSPQFGWFGSKPKSFEVVNRMAVGITDEVHLQLIATLSDNNEEVMMAGMEFEHTGKAALSEQVKALALDKALAQQAAIESRLGVTLVPIGLSEQVMTPGWDRGRIEEIVVTAQRTASDSRAQAPGMKSSPSPQTFDEVEYQATVYVTFKVVPK